MHKHHQSEPGYYRSWLTLGLPENPVCWLFGHRPRPVITEYRFGIAPSLWIDCAVCGRRYSDPDQRSYLEQQVAAGKTYKEAAEELTARRVANARRLPAAQFCADVNRRTGWHDRSLQLHHEAHWPSRKEGAKRRGGGGRNGGIKFHVGNEASETPFDGHVTAGPFGYYWSVGGVGGRLASWLGRGHKRDLSLNVFGGHLWWRLWYDDDGGHDAYHRCDSWRKPQLWPWSRGRSKHRSWMCLRDGSIRLNPADELWGPPKPHRVVLPGQTPTLAVPVGEFPGDTYLVDVRLERWTWLREHGPAWARRVQDVHYEAEWRAEGEGIPFRNHSWKGDGVIGSGVRLPDPLPADWQRIVVESIVERVKADRRRYRYSPPKPTS